MINSERVASEEPSLGFGHDRGLRPQIPPAPWNRRRERNVSGAAARKRQRIEGDSKERGDFRGSNLRSWPNSGLFFGFCRDATAELRGVGAHVPARHTQYAWPSLCQHTWSVASGGLGISLVLFTYK